MAKGIVTEGLGVEGECLTLEALDGFGQDSLRRYTSAGWVLVAIYQEDSVHAGNSWYDQGKGVQMTEYTPVTTTRLVLRRSADDTLAAMATERDDALAKASKAEYALEQAGEAQTEAEQQVASLEENVERQRLRASAAEDRLREVDAKATKLERQMAAVRRQVGELNLNEMLGEEAS